MIRRFSPSRTAALVAWFVTFVAATSLAGWGPFAEDRSATQAAEQHEACRAVRFGVDELAREHPEAPVGQFREQPEQICRNGALPVPTPPEPRPKSYPGCHALPAYEARVPLRRRSAEPPKRGAPFFATRAGALPATGTPTVGGVLLPRGSRCLHHWATDEPVRDPAGLAARLATAFPRTGLWPVLWMFPSDDPDSYMNASSDPAVADRLDASRVLGRLWSWRRPGGRFHGLARGSTDAGTREVAADPFGTAARSWGDDAATGAPPEAGWVLLLVPCNRPADVLSVLGPELTEVMSDDDLTAVLRSWEERFGAVVTAVGPGSLDLVIDAPPRDETEALLLAAEQAAFAPEDDSAPDSPGALRELARQLRSPTRPGMPRSRSFWQFGWPD